MYCRIRFGCAAALVLAQFSCLPPVPALEDDGGGGSTTADGTDTSQAQGTTDGTAEPGDETTTSMGQTGPVDPSDTDDTDDATTGAEPTCCHGGCEGSCIDGACEEQTLSDPFPNEAAVFNSAAMVGDDVVWSTGWAGTLEIYEPGVGARTLASVPSGGAVTMMLPDGDHVYFLDWGGPLLRRASVPGGGIDVVAQVLGMEPHAGFGSLIADQTHVYFAMQGTGSIYRAPKDLSAVDAQLVAVAGQPAGIGISQRYLFWTSNEGATQVVFRLALADVELENRTPELVYEGSSISGLVADDDGLFIVDDGTVLGVNPFGTNQGIVYLEDSESWVADIAMDEMHVYWAGGDSQTVARARRDGGGSVEVLSSTGQPTAIALSCDTVYWLGHADRRLHARAK